MHSCPSWDIRSRVHFAPYDSYLDTDVSPVRHGRVGSGGLRDLIILHPWRRLKKRGGGGQSSTMTPNARTEGSMFYINIKSVQKGIKIYNSKKYRGQNFTTVGVLKEGGQKSMILKKIEYTCEKEIKILPSRALNSFTQPKLNNGFQNGVKILHEWKNRGQNSTSLKMGVKILHGWKEGSKFYNAWKRGSIFYIWPLKVGVKILYRLKKGGWKGWAYPIPQT